MGGIDVVAADRTTLREFIELPYTLYRDDPHFVPPLRMAVKDLLNRAKHPFYKTAEAEFFVARRNGRPLGRIAAILDHEYNRFQNEQAGFFGFFDCVDDIAVAEALLTRARSWVFEKGARILRGPVNPSANYECGLLIEGFDSDPMVMMTYNFPYYATLMDRLGLRKAKDLLAYASTPDEVELTKIKSAAARVLKRTGVEVRPINMKDFEGEVARVWEVYCSAWSRNWGFAPMSREEFLLQGKDLKLVLKPELVLIGEAGGKMVGFALALPDINQALKPAKGRLFPAGILKILYHQRHVRNVRVVALGVVPEHRASGVAAAFYAQLVENARKLGYQQCEMSWILEDNILMNRSIEVMGAKRYKTYRIYEWS